MDLIFPVNIIAFITVTLVMTTCDHIKNFSKAIYVCIAICWCISEQASKGLSTTFEGSSNVSYSTTLLLLVL